MKICLPYSKQLFTFILKIFALKNLIIELLSIQVLSFFQLFSMCTKDAKIPILVTRCLLVCSASQKMGPRA